jgi:hypothetical protein
MPGHIKLGKYADSTLRDYLLVDPKQYQSATANPFAAKVSTGGPYHDQDQFNDWTVQDWHTGVGNTDPERGQLFSVADTRYPNFAWNPFAFEYPLGALTVYGGNDYENSGDFTPTTGREYAMSFTGVTGDCNGVWVYIYCPTGYTMTAKLYTQTGSLPGTAQRTNTATSNMKRVHAHWVWFSWSAYTMTAGGTYYISITTNCPTSGLEPNTYIPAVMPIPPELGFSKNGASPWAQEYYMGGSLGFQFLLAVTSIGEIKGVYVMDDGLTADNAIYVWHDDKISKVVGGALVAELTTDPIVDVKRVGQYLYISNGLTTGFGYTKFNTKYIQTLLNEALDSSETGVDVDDASIFSIGTTIQVDSEYMYISGKSGNTLTVTRGYGGTTAAAHSDNAIVKLQAQPDKVTYHNLSSLGVLVHGGFVWNYTLGELSYTPDDTNPALRKIITFGDGRDYHSYPTGMAGAGDAVYVATPYGLHLIAGGDFPVQILVWPEMHKDNGKGMVAWEDALYIPMGDGTLMRFDTNGGLINVGMNARYPLPADVQGKIVALYPTNYFLFASVQPRSATGYPTLWAYNVDGWHCVALGPQGTTGKAICIDRISDKLFWGTTRGLLHRTNYPSGMTNPAYSTNELILARDGWIEYDRFFAGHHTLNKDFDRILFDTDQANGYIYTYWKNLSNDAWVYSSSANHRFSATKRPTGTWVRFGFRLSAQYVTPILRAIAIKYSTNITDRWRWVLSIPVGDKQQFPDGKLNPYTAAQQITHLEDLIDETSPLQYQDIDGTIYYVTITGASRNISEWSYKPPGSGKTVIKWVYTITLEELPT